MPCTTMKRIGRCTWPGCAGFLNWAMAPMSLLRTSLNALALAAEPPAAEAALGFCASAVAALAAADLRAAT